MIYLEAAFNLIFAGALMALFVYALCNPVENLEEVEVEVRSIL